MTPRIRFVVASRESEQNFFTHTATGKSLALYNLPFGELHLRGNNTRGLPEVYNQAIEASEYNPAILVFIHDDVHLCDFYWADQVLHSLTCFQLVGVAGNKRRVPNQPSWAFIDTRFTWDLPENLSGIVGHGRGFPPSNLSAYGDPRQEVKLLDGLMLIAKSETLIRNKIRFDERFFFNCYDMDICREAEAKGLRMGTWPISVIHESSGRFGSEDWYDDYNLYLDKWGG